METAELDESALEDSYERLIVGKGELSHGDEEGSDEESSDEGNSDDALHIE